MKLKKIFLILLFLPFIFSCDKAEDFKVAEPITYYLCYEPELSLITGPGGGWQYITNYIYPDAPLNTNSWSVYLDKNVVKGEFGCNLIFWAASECQVKFEILLEKDDQETVLYTKNLTIHYHDEYTAAQFFNDAEVNPLAGTNPKSGKNKYLIIRLTHIAGSVPVEIIYDGATGTIGNSSITVFHDK